MQCDCPSIHSRQTPSCSRDVGKRGRLLCYGTLDFSLELCSQQWKREKEGELAAKSVALNKMLPLTMCVSVRAMRRWGLHRVSATGSTCTPSFPLQQAAPAVGSLPRSLERSEVYISWRRQGVVERTTSPAAGFLSNLLLRSLILACGIYTHD